jgi:hypothetical protein
VPGPARQQSSSRPGRRPGARNPDGTAADAGPTAGGGPVPAARRGESSLPVDYDRVVPLARPMEVVGYVLPRVSGDDGPWRNLLRYLVLVLGCVASVALGLVGVVLAAMWGAHRWLDGHVPTGVVITLAAGSFGTITTGRLLRSQREHRRGSAGPDSPG